MAIEVTKPPEGGDQIIPESGPDSYVVIDSQRHPIVGWRWDGERGHPLVAFEDGVWEVVWEVVNEMCVRGQSMVVKDAPYYGEPSFESEGDYDSLASDLQRRDDR